MSRMKTMLWVVMVIAICFVTGCADEQRSDPKVWGQGNPPAEWQKNFGNDNLSRFNFIQTQNMNKIGNALADLSERVKVLESPKAEDHSKCILDIDGKCCTVKGCKVVNPDKAVTK